MKYINAKEILPEHILEIIQDYVEGELVYIPIGNNKASWGKKSGAKDELINRNNAIYESYQRGLTVEELMGEYNLSESSIRKIVWRAGKNNRAKSIVTPVKADLGRCVYER